MLIRPVIQRLPVSRPLFSLHKSINIQRRAMSTFEYLVIIPDKPGTLQKRLEVRAQHLEGAKKLTLEGPCKMGGALLNATPDNTDPTTWDFHGSTLVVEAESKEEIQAMLAKDIYASSGVWDLEKVQIFPFKCAIRKEL